MIQTCMANSSKYSSQCKPKHVSSESVLFETFYNHMSISLVKRGILISPNYWYTCERERPRGGRLVLSETQYDFIWPLIIILEGYDRRLFDVDFDIICTSKLLSHIGPVCCIRKGKYAFVTLTNYKLKN